MLYSQKPWWSVVDVAHYLSLSPEMIYKLVQRGEIPALKIGTSWRINSEELQQWIVSKKTPSSSPAHRPTFQKALDEFQKRLKGHYRKNFSALYIYGSWPRGTSGPESDLDTLVILKKVKDRWEEIPKIRKMAYQASFGQGIPVVLSVLVASEKEFATRQDPLFCRIREEGKKAA